MLMDNKLTEYILKHSRRHDRELKYDFMPSLLEIIERPMHRAGTIIILSGFTLLIAVVVWACLSEIDVVITSNGSIQPAGNVNVVEAYVSGTVKGIYVAEGQHVNQGDVLIELDTQSIDIDVNQLDYQKEILEAERGIYEQLQSEKSADEIDISKYGEDIHPFLQAILDTDLSYYNSLENLELEKTNTELNQKIAQLQLEEYQSGGTTRQQESEKLTIQQYDNAMEQIELQIYDAKTQYSAQINSRLSEIDGQLEEINNGLEKYNLSKEYQTITAPVSGYVNSVGVNTFGETVSMAEQLITIVPDNEPIEMVCYVKNMDIADIEIGMEAEIKLEAYPYNRYGTVRGVVKYISPSAFTSEQLGSVYLVKLDIEDMNETINIFSGLSGTVEIKIGKRTIMDYFMEPIIKGFGDSLKEK
jgi:multidrug resistance efflux pump